MKSTTKNLIKRCLFIVFIIVLITVVFSIVVRYDIVGEANLPYSIDKILIVSQVSTSSNDDPDNVWNISLEEFNDIYITISKTDEESDNTIKDVTLENFKIKSAPVVGNVAIYKPTGDIGSLYTLSEQNYMDDSITFTGAAVDTMKSLEIRNEGGTIGFRASLENLGAYVSNNYDEEIIYDGNLLTKADIVIEDMKFTLSFDVLITLNNDVTFKGTIDIDLPNEDVITNMESNIELTDFSDVIFKRV